MGRVKLPKWETNQVNTLPFLFLLVVSVTACLSESIPWSLDFCLPYNPVWQ